VVYLTEKGVATEGAAPQLCRTDLIAMTLVRLIELPGLFVL
jgi:hypothetical protein